jgi:lipopolysaccharide/colanic/teichoic acid biosynthesis glycosyltransferase
VTPEAQKRTLDIVLAAGAAIVLWPLWMGISGAILLTSPGPVLYAGERVGRCGRRFRMYKFRTMSIGTGNGGPAITVESDARVTPLGRLLRSRKLDEIPQLLNVLRGEMSLVGPRPEDPTFVAFYDERQREVLSVRPGVTGPTQLAYRDEERMLEGHDVEEYYLTELMPKKLEMDLAYIRTRTFAGDVGILFSTVASVVRP